MGDLIGQTTQIINRINHSGTPLTGHEVFPVTGNAINFHAIQAIMHTLRGLDFYYDCNLKAKIVLEWVRQFMDPQAKMAIGSFAVDDIDGKSQFGFEFNPPLEFHMWVELSNHQGIIDFSLPGVITLGLNTCDQYGPILTNRTPFILAGPTPDFLHYKSYITMEDLL